MRWKQRLYNIWGLSNMVDNFHQTVL